MTNVNRETVLAVIAELEHAVSSTIETSPAATINKWGDKAGPNDIRIAILSYGWVFVGRYEPVAGGIRLTDSKCLVQFGTDKGLGKLVLHGPTKDTVLDDTNILTAPSHSVVALLECVPENWESVFGK